MKVETVSTTRCTLGEGPMWHPERNQFFWFDILERRLLTLEDGSERHWQFDEYVSAAGWVDRTRMMIATQTRLMVFDIEAGTQSDVCALEADNSVTRSNDGRADPQGGFWIGTMGIGLEPHAGAIYRWHRGELRQLYAGITVSNSICFSPAGDLAYWTDTPTRRIMAQPLDADGWPHGAPSVFADLGVAGVNPDGSVVDARGVLWNAQWGAGRVAGYGPDGQERAVIDIPASQTTCPAFGGPELRQMYVTSAAENLPDEMPAGQTFRVEMADQGQPEHRVVL